MVVLTAVVVGAGSASGGITIPPKEHPASDAYRGWRLGCQSYTFRKYTFYEAVDKVASLGMGWIEAYPGQRVSEARGDVKMGPEMSADVRREVKGKLREAGVRLVNFGVVRLSNDERECREIFDFASDMGIETIVSEPPEDAFDLLDRLCKEYRINIAIHNHPKNSKYWSPDKVLEVCEGRSQWIGACADTGHWMRSGVDPLEAIKKLEGRITSLHFKDLNVLGERKAHDVVWGTGKANVVGILAELHRQRFRGVFSVEYEHNWENSVPEIRGCVGYFNKVASELKSSGWEDILADGLGGWTYNPGHWKLEEGVLVRLEAKEHGYIWTKERYGDFVLDLEFKMAEKTNSGIFLRTDNPDDPVQTGMEIQVYDSYGKAEWGNHDCGALYDCQRPSKNMAKRPGEWNRCTITCKGSRIYVMLNGEQVIDVDLNEWTEAHKNPDGSKNKYDTAYKDMPRVGHIGFQDHGHSVSYRNIKIKHLN